MFKRKSLNLSVKAAEHHIDKLTDEISNKYNIDIMHGPSLQNGDAFTSDGLRGDFYIYIGAAFEENNSIFKRTDDIEFLKCICACYHEEQHIKQNCSLYQDETPNEYVIQAAIRKLASSENRDYYEGHYYEDLSEIDAEYVALLRTHCFITKNFKSVDADFLMCELINEKAKPRHDGKYYITGKFKSFTDAMDKFKQHFYQAQSTKTYGMVPELRLSQEVDPKKDEYVRFLQTCVRNNSVDRELLTQFNRTKTAPEKDLMIASITQHLHPDVDFKRIYPCLETVDLEPEIVFGRPLQTCLQVHESDIDKELLEQRIEKAKDWRENHSDGAKSTSW